ncbi:MAG: caspase family protein [Candidatus Celaenobacter antarcticus]|nr:caspase family protein [Candidatus Celaenobacter antarcticus]
MKRIILLIFFLSVFSSLFAYENALEVLTDIPGASIYFDGKYIGISENFGEFNLFRLDDIKPGLHSLKCTYNEYEPFTRSVEIPNEGIAKIQANFMQTKWDVEDITDEGMGKQVKIRGIKIKTSDGKTFQLYDKSYALVIGISDYKYWKDLPNAVKDVDAVANELEKIGFEVTKITDNTYTKPTRTNIITALNKLQKTSSDDRIIIYYAGHGNSVPIPYQEGYYNGYIIPEDAHKDDVSSYISMNTIKDITMMYNAKHVLYLFDSCFSGHFVDITRADNKPESIITEKIAKPVRQVISAGSADQEASDGVFHSPFCEAVLDNLQNMSGDYNNDGYLTGEELSFNIRQKVEYDTHGDQTPEYGKMRGFKDGDFVFCMSCTPQTQPDIEVETEYSYGTIKVESNADGSVYIDNDYVCSITKGTIKTLNNVRTGSHNVKMKTDDETKTEYVTVQKNRTTSLNFYFIPKSTGDYNMVFLKGGTKIDEINTNQGKYLAIKIPEDKTITLNDSLFNKNTILDFYLIPYNNSEEIRDNKEIKITSNEKYALINICFNNQKEEVELNRDAYRKQTKMTLKRKIQDALENQIINSDGTIISERKIPEISQKLGMISINNQEYFFAISKEKIKDPVTNKYVEKLNFSLVPEGDYNPFEKTIRKKGEIITEQGLKNCYQYAPIRIDNLVNIPQTRLNTN